MDKLPFPKRIDVYIHIFTLLVIMNAWLPLYRRMTGFRLDVIEGDPLRRNIMLLGYGLALLPCIIKPGRMIGFLIKHPYVILILLLAVASVFQSGYPTVAYRRVIALILTVFYAIALYLQFPKRSLLNLLGIVFLIITISSIMLAILMPSWGVMSGVHAGAWRGVLLHKNSLGKFSVIGIIFFSYLWKTTRWQTLRHIWGLAVISSLVVIYKADSISAYLLFIVVIITAVLIRVAQAWKRDWQLVLILLIFIVGFGLMIISDQIELGLSLLGREGTLTGRIPLWTALGEMILAQPLGYGYGTFWMGENDPSGLIFQIVRWQPAHAHNGFIDLALQLGWPGLLTMLGLLVFFAARHFFDAMSGHTVSGLWFILLTFVILYNVSESSLLAYNSIYTVLLLLTFFSSNSMKKAINEQIVINDVSP